MQITAAILFSLACIPGLEAPRAYPVPAVWRLVAADVDVDGHPDVVTSHQFGIEISYNRGGTLAPPVPLFPEPEQGLSWHLADVDADARPDFILTRYAPSTDEQVTVLRRNLGDRRFGAPESIARASRGAVQAVLDFTNDGSPDLLIPRGELPALLAVNDGRGHFTVRETAPIPRAIRAAGDIDGDGDGDLLHAEGTRLFITRSNGQGGFAATESRVLPTEFVPVLADLDSDRRNDLLALLRDWGQVEIYPDAAAQPSSKILYAGLPRDVTTGDFNGDGTLDVAIYSETNTEPDVVLSSAPRLLIYLNDRGGRFVRAPDVLVDGQSSASIAATADFNGDGALDLVVPAGEGWISLVFGNGDGTFLGPRTVQHSRYHALAMAADLDGDGIDEVLTRTISPGLEAYAGRISVGWLTADGTYAFEALPQDLYALGELAHVAPGDVNEHGTRTLVTGGRERLRVFSRTAPGTWEEIASIPSGQVLAVQAGDLTGDGRSERLAVVAEGQVAHLRVYDAAGSVRTSLEVGRSFAWYDIQVAELTGDTHADLLFTYGGSYAASHHDPDPQDGYLALFPGRGDGTFDAPRRLLDETRPGLPRLGHFNGDGRTDIAVDQRLLAGDGRGHFAISALPFHAGLAADVNGDGVTDLLSGTALWQGTRAGVFVHRGTYMFGSSLQGMAIVRRSAAGPLTLLGIVDYAGEFIAADFTCSAPRRRTIRP
ncbi:MAG TPA: VCBS repeat-containing protein [Thermoanaerobaculia bacterium]|nr:VCBS repeat-containing protein [Thermoanaerobaculia bacterium]